MDDENNADINCFKFQKICLVSVIEVDIMYTGNKALTSRCSQNKT